MIALLRIEMRRNVLPVLIPVLGGLVLLSPIARNLTPVALWPDRSTDVQSSIQIFGPFGAGAGAWMAARERRRDMDGLLTTTPRSRWSREMATWAATTGWMVLCYVVLTSVVFTVTAFQATWGGPVWWPILVGLIALVAFSAVGFALGMRLPSRFTAPLAAVGLFAIIALGMNAALDGATWGLLTPLYPAIGLASAVFYPLSTHLAVIQILCYTGIMAIALATVLIRKTRFVLLVAGILLSTTAATLLASSHRNGPSFGHGQAVIVPLLGDSTHQPVAYTPVCAGTPIPVCLHPAYSGDLNALVPLVNAIAAPLAGAPGLPVRAEQRPELAEVSQAFRVVGSPPVLTISHFIVHHDTVDPPQLASNIQSRIALGLSSATEQPTHAQRAVATFLLSQAKDTPDPALLPPDPAEGAAAGRLSAPWLVQHLTAIRDGSLTLQDMP
jgi:ABC-type transport system involved in multi-copper enzyme maturation permease subunit